MTYSNTEIALTKSRETVVGQSPRHDFERGSVVVDVAFSRACIKPHQIGDAI